MKEFITISYMNAMFTQKPREKDIDLEKVVSFPLILNLFFFFGLSFMAVWALSVYGQQTKQSLESRKFM